MIDSHAHIYLDQFKEDTDAVIQRALGEGVKRILLPNIDETSIESMLSLEEQYPDICYSMMGLHPCSVKEDFERQLEVIDQWLTKRSFIAIGEMGTDLYWDKTFWEQQKEAFHFQCKLALKYELPIVIHCRETIDQTIDLVSQYKGQGLTGVFHCFTGSVEQATQITELGFYLGLGGVSTFKNSGMDKVIPELEKTRVMLETDAPYLAPVPFRGKRNEPSYLSHIAQKVADCWDLSPDRVKEITENNTNKLFFSAENL